MKVVYIAAPLNAPTLWGRTKNRMNAARWTAWAARQGVAPVATWVVLSGEWNESPAAAWFPDCLRLRGRLDAAGHESIA
jgi:hypothetical protein